MPKGINRVQLIGNLGQDVQTSATQNHTMVARFSMATTQEWKDATGQKQSATEWHNCVAFQKLAEICHTWLKKGTRVYVEGHLKTSHWEDQQQNKKSRTDIVVETLLMLDRPKEEGSAPSQSAPPTPPPAPATSEFDDDIPF